MSTILPPTNTGRNGWSGDYRGENRENREHAGDDGDKHRRTIEQLGRKSTWTGINGLSISEASGTTVSSLAGASTRKNRTMDRSCRGAPSPLPFLHSPALNPASSTPSSGRTSPRPSLSLSTSSLPSSSLPSPSQYDDVKRQNINGGKVTAGIVEAESGKEKDGKERTSKEGQFKEPSLKEFEERSSEEAEEHSLMDNPSLWQEVIEEEQIPLLNDCKNMREKLELFSNVYELNCTDVKVLKRELKLLGRRIDDKYLSCRRLRTAITLNREKHKCRMELSALQMEIEKEMTETKQMENEKQKLINEIQDSNTKKSKNMVNWKYQEQALKEKESELSVLIISLQGVGKVQYRVSKLESKVPNQWSTVSNLKSKIPRAIGNTSSSGQTVDRMVAAALPTSILEQCQPVCVSSDRPVTPVAIIRSTSPLPSVSPPSSSFSPPTSSFSPPSVSLHPESSSTADVMGTVIEAILPFIVSVSPTPPSSSPPSRDPLDRPSSPPSSHSFSPSSSPSSYHPSTFPSHTSSTSSHTFDMPLLPALPSPLCLDPFVIRPSSPALSPPLSSPSSPILSPALSPSRQPPYSSSAKLSRSLSNTSGGMYSSDPPPYALHPSDPSDQSEDTWKDSNGNQDNSDTSNSDGCTSIIREDTDYVVDQLLKLMEIKISNNEKEDDNYEEEGRVKVENDDEEKRDIIQESHNSGISIIMPLTCLPHTSILTAFSAFSPMPSYDLSGLTSLSGDGSLAFSPSPFPFLSLPSPSPDLPAPTHAFSSPCPVSPSRPSSPLPTPSFTPLPLPSPPLINHHLPAPLSPCPDPLPNSSKKKRTKKNKKICTENNSVPVSLTNPNRNPFKVAKSPRHGPEVFLLGLDNDPPITTSPPRGGDRISALGKRQE